VSANETQVLLIGSGVAAVTVAETLLSAHPDTRIVMLEAGQVYPSKDRRAWWDYVMTGKAAYSEGEDPKEKLDVDFQVDSNVQWDCDNNRVIAYGGSTLHWGGWSLRLKPEDFHLRENTGQGADWPFGYDELHDHYYQAEQRLAVCGDESESWNHLRSELREKDRLTGEKTVIRKAQPYPLPPFEWTEADGEMIAAFRRLGIEPGRMPLARFRKCMATGTCKYCPVGARYNAQDALDELRDRFPGNLDVRESCPVSEILMKPKRRAIGARYFDGRTKEGAMQTVLAECVIVCSGAYESPKLLLRSGKPHWPKGIGNRYDQVGRYLVSHSILRALGRRRGNEDCWVQEYDFPTLMSRTYDAPEYQRHGKLFLFKNRKLPHLNFADAMIAGLPKVDIERQLRGERRMEIQAFLEEKGKFENRVEIGEGETDKRLPATKITFHRTDAEMADAHSRLELLKRVILEMGYEVIECQVDRPGGHHATGTCRMSANPQQGVVDPDLKVHGTENLYVCSNAVMPTGSAVNPTLTLTALALRLGHHLNELSGKSGDGRKSRARAGSEK
jgi:choline dehydrogenase-like flavoprotein